MNSLVINDIRLWVRLGCTQDEQAQPQMVRVDVNLSFKNMPQGCVSDNIEDTVCYAGVVEMVQSVALQKSYNLIEHLASTLHDALQQKINICAVSSVSVCKVSPPVSLVHGGVTFTSVRGTNAA